VLLQHLAADHHGYDLLLFGHLPVDILLHVRVIGVQGNHARRPARGAAALDGRCGAVAHPQERQQPGRDPAAAQRFLLGPQGGVVGAGSRAVLEQAGLAGDQVRDPPRIHQVVLDGDDEAVVNQDIVRQVLPALGLDVIDLHEPQELNPLNRLFFHGRNLLPWKSI
jgi:hypothetical protein